MEYIRNLKDITKEDILLAGGKGASLGEMIQVGIPVPPGFVVTAKAFDEFYQKEDFSPEFNKELEESFKNLGAESVAVRSSATAEDSDSAAWPGQLETYLNTDEDSLIENIRNCWESLSSPRAKAYRKEKGLDDVNISVAVIVQKMIPSEVAGVAFSMHPVTQNPKEIVIEAVQGLGENLVSGQVTPDRYIVNKDSGEVGLEEIQNQQLLAQEKISELSRLVLKIESHYSFPCDIEWAFAEDTFYILQSRPITTFVRKFQKFFSRQLPLSTMEYWYLGESQEFPKLIEKATCFNPLFIRGQNGVVDVYYDINNPDTALEPLFNYFSEKQEEFWKLSKDFESKLDSVEKTLNRLDLDKGQKLFQDMVTLWGYLPIWVQIGNLQSDILPEPLKKESLKLRDQFQDIEYKAGDLLADLIAQSHSELEKFKDVISFKEFTDNKIPKGEILLQREKKFIYFEGQMLENLSEKEFEDKFHIQIDQSLALIDEYQPNQNLILVATRRTNIFEASLRIDSWTRGLQRELGKGYKELIINSNGEYYVDLESNTNIDAILKSKSVKNALEYIDKMYQCRESSLEHVKENADDLKEDLSDLFTYFFIARKISEEVFHQANSEERETIEKWRNDPALFEPLEIIQKQQTETEEQGDWSLVYKKGSINFVRRIIGKADQLNNSDGLLRGSSAFPGNVSGPVVIVNSVQDLPRVRPGDIVVSPMTTPDYISIIHIAAGIVTDEGGITSHAAIIARELKKPCIVGAKIATKVLKDGDRIEVDADHGLVKILD